MKGGTTMFWKFLIAAGVILLLAAILISPWPAAEKLSTVALVALVSGVIAQMVTSES